MIVYSDKIAKKKLENFSELQSKKISGMSFLIWFIANYIRDCALKSNHLMIHVIDWLLSKCYQADTRINGTVTCGETRMPPPHRPSSKYDPKKLSS